MNKSEAKLPYRIRAALDPIPVIASLPHSGLYVPPQMRSGLKETYREFLPHQDWHLDRLYSFLPELGVTMLLATYSRYVADPNRGPDGPSFGGFWRAVVSDSTPRNEPLYDLKPTKEEVEQRLREVYRPYHDRLERLLIDTVDRFGCAYLLDLHSFGLPGDYRICFGDANGKSCREPFVAKAENAWSG